MTPPRPVNAALLAMVLACAAITGRPASAADAATWSGSLKKVFADRCFACHGALAQQGGLRLDTVAGLLAGGDAGPVVIPGDPTAGSLAARIVHADPAERMPPEAEGEPLSPQQIETLKAWIAAGCPAPADEVPEADPREHWAFQPRVRPAVPLVAHPERVRNPIDAFLEAVRERTGIAPQPEASREVLVRRLHLDLVGLPPQPEELAAILADASPDWYETLVDRLLADPRHGERWGRHWMDVWRYADWWGLGDQLRNSQKHIWHWRDWIIESLNADTGYDEMVRLMLAADEIAPDDLPKLRATGFLARNWFLFNRTPWMDETVEHVAKGFLGLSLNCAKCHDHKYDPLRQEDYYAMRAFFEPLHARLDVLPGEPDLERDGIPRVFDGVPDVPTFLFVRGEDTKPDTSRPILPGVAAVFDFASVDVRPVSLPKTESQPARRPWVIDAYLAAAGRRVEAARAARDAAPSPGSEQAVAIAAADLAAVERRGAAMRAGWAAEDLAGAGSDDAIARAAAAAAREAVRAERALVAARAKAGLLDAEAKLAAAAAEAIPAAEKAVADSRTALEQAEQSVAEPGEAFTPLVGARWTPTRFANSSGDDPAIPFPTTSTGRRSALAAWITAPGNPLTARVAANHLWARHMGRALVPTVFDFGRKGTPPDHPELLDWLASELVEGSVPGPHHHAWSMKRLHRLIVTSAAYRLQSSTAGNAEGVRLDPDNRTWWRREPIRLESEAVRDSILALAGTLDTRLGGAPVPAAEQPASTRRSLYFQHTDPDRNPFLTTFDGAGVKECYERERSIVPQQALALANAGFVHDAAARIAARIALSTPPVDEAAFIDRAFRTVLGRSASAVESEACVAALAQWRSLEPAPADGAVEPARIHLVWALLNHTDFVTLR
jgi:mono/diheme cytochrome c family protein